MPQELSQLAMISQSLRWGLRGRCPRCGQGALFETWHQIRERCPQCDLEYEPSAGDTWFFMYMTTGGLTGVMIVAMLLSRPSNLFLAQLVLIPVAILVIGGTLPYRKGLAVAIDYLIEQRVGSTPVED